MNHLHCAGCYSRCNHATVEGDHMWLQDGLMHRHDIRDFYLDMLSMIDGLETKEGKIDIPSVL